MMRRLLFSSGIIKACIWGAKVELGVGEVTGNITNSGEPLNTREQSQRPTLWLLHASQGVDQAAPCWSRQLGTGERQLDSTQDFILS